MDRRLIIKGLAATATMGSAIALRAQARKLTIAGSGGIVGDVSKAVYIEPFTASTGVAIDYVPTEQQIMPQLEAMVRAGNTTWDVMEISGSNYPLGVKRGLFTELDYARIDPQNKLAPIARKPFGVGVASYSEVLIVRKDRLPAGKTLTGWADFWDVRSFPGPRALAAVPKSNLEFALVADGVKPAEVYKVLANKEGLERAFKKLDQVKPHISRFWKSGAESVQLLTSGDAAFCSAYNGRIESVRAAGVPADIVWNGGVLHVSYIGIPKGSRNVELASDFIRTRALDAAKMRQAIAKVPYPGFAPGLTDGLPPAAVALLPTYPPNLAVQIQADEAFWADNLASIQERWNEWMLQ